VYNMPSAPRQAKGTQHKKDFTKEWLRFENI
jgi:hypothetical protein